MTKVRMLGSDPWAIILMLGMIMLAGCATQPESAATGQPNEGYVESSEGVELYYRMFGAAGDTVVVVHGGPGLDQGYLSPDLEPLAESRTLIFYDQRGAGRSTLVSNATSLHLEAHIADLEAVRRHFGIEHVVLLGHSWGALLAARYALANPGRVAKLVLVSPGAIRHTPYEVEIDVTAWMDATTLAELEALNAAFRVPASDIRAVCRSFFGLFMRGGYYDPTDPAAPQRMRGDFCSASDEAIRNFWVVNDLTLESLGDYDWRADFRGVQVPALVITGVGDIFPVERRS